MTLKQAQRLYNDAGKIEYGHGWSLYDYSSKEWKDIQREMTEITDASSERKACKVIRWWGCWNQTWSCISFVRTVRRVWKQMQRKKRQ